MCVKCPHYKSYVRITEERLVNLQVFFHSYCPVEANNYFSFLCCLLQKYVLIWDLLGVNNFSYCLCFQISSCCLIGLKQYTFLSAIFLFPSFHRISPCITQLEEQWRDLDLTSWQIQGCRTTTPVLWFSKPCHLRNPVLSLHKHLPQIDRLGKSVPLFSFLCFSGSSICM